MAKKKKEFKGRVVPSKEGRRNIHDVLYEVLVDFNNLRAGKTILEYTPSDAADHLHKTSNF